MLHRRARSSHNEADLCEIAAYGKYPDVVNFLTSAVYSECDLKV